MVDVNTDAIKALEELRAELRAISERLTVLESAKTEPKTAAVTVDAPVPAAAKVPEPRPEPISEEILLVISAAVAAFLGERAHIRQVRLISSPFWAIHGRASIQASHKLLR
jgi:methylmalonyl-CoA carboxyltransferase 12S subunit